jgi:hypothetical protein
MDDNDGGKPGESLWADPKRKGGNFSALEGCCCWSQKKTTTDWDRRYRRRLLRDVDDSTHHVNSFTIIILTMLLLLNKRFLPSITSIHMRIQSRLDNVHEMALIVRLEASLTCILPGVIPQHQQASEDQRSMQQWSRHQRMPIANRQVRRRNPIIMAGITCRHNVSRF